MHPVIFEFVRIRIYSYGLMVALAFLITTFLVRRSIETVGIPKEKFDGFALWLLVSGIIGARLFYVILNIKDYMDSPLEILMLNHGGLVFFGGLLSALIVGVWFLKRNKLPAWKLVDFIVPYAALGHSIGRMGCYLNGCCYGKPWGGKLGVIFPPDSLAGMAFPYEKIFPIQIFSSFLLLMLFLILSLIYKYKRFDGEVVASYLILYSIARFIIEFFRGDNPHVAFGLTVFQIIYLVIFFVAVPIYLWQLYQNLRLQSRVLTQGRD